MTVSVARELENLRGPDGLIRPQDAVDWARNNPSSELYKRLQWDDRIAGEAWRISQIRSLIAVHIVDPDGYRREISLSVDRAEGGGYRNVDAVMSTQRLREIALQDALAELQRFEQKYKWLTELAEVFEARAEAASAAQPPARRSRRRSGDDARPSA